MTKRIKNLRLQDIDVNYNSVDDVIKKLTDAKKQFESAGWMKITVELKEEFYPYDMVGNWKLILFGDRYETDKEYKKRTQQEATENRKLRDKEIAELERLREKYDGEE